ncbi:MAG: tetratricopeptide repeat protein, partial [Planctomycetaceae bacterium]|nr:tetratricopeptide repeat protein [Planctomycetaceae bacterium]
ECHMPSKTYMGVDPRRDHSLRIPRPDLTVKLGTPNACNQCHTKPEENAKWAAHKVEEWYGPKRRDDPHYGEILAAGRTGKPEAEAPLIKLTREKEVGPIVRATAVSLLATRYNTPESRKVVERALKSKEELVRLAALQGFEGWAPGSEQEASQIGKLLAEGLTDSSRGVRTEVARILTGLPVMPDTSQNQKALKQALEEYKAGLLADGDQSGSHMSLGILYANQGDLKKAEDEFRTAIKLSPAVAGPRSNLAQLLEQLGRADEVKELRTKEAELLARDARLLPDNPMLQYRLGLLYYLLGREDEAVTALKQACELEPQSADFRLMLTLLYEKQEQWKLAWESAAALVRLQPNNQQFRQIY